MTRALLALLGGLTVFYLAFLAGLPVGRADGLFERWLGLAVEVGAALACVCRVVLMREERRVWALVALSVSLWTLGDVYWRIALWDLEVMPVPSLADVGWLAFYAPAFAAIALLVHARVESVRATLWVDGVIGGLAVASVAAAVVFDAVLGSVGGKPAVVATGLAYPICDMVLIALVMGGLHMSGRRLDSTWLWLGAGLATFAVSDSVYLVQTARETYAPGGVLDAGWAVALTLVAFAAWRPAAPRVKGEEREGWGTIVLPIGFAVVALAVDVFDHFYRVNVLALILATACLGAVLARLALAFAQNLRMLVRFRLLVANIPGAVYRRALDPDMTIEFVSETIEEISGYAAARLADSEERTYASVVHPDDRDRVAEEVRVAVAGDRQYELAYRIVRADGEEAWVGDRGRAVDDSSGVVWSYGAVSDIDERKRLEADHARMELELRMAQKLEAVGRLAAGIAHEINTPIQFVGDTLDFLQESFGDLERLLGVYRDVLTAARVAPELRDRVALAEEEADVAYLHERVPAAYARTLDGVERVASIVRAMKAFAHPQTEQAPADLNQALAATLAVARNEYRYVADVETRFADLPRVVCNLSEVNQVFLNLIVNAAHAIEDAPQAPGGLGTIAITTARAGDAAVVCVSDSGCGIPEEISTRIFDPFFTTKTLGRGSGQGLAISRAVVEKHGGTLDFETQPGSGTTFTITLPIVGAKPAPLAAA